MSYPFHPELSAQRFLPRGYGRRWSLPLMRAALRASAVAGRSMEYVDVGSTTLFVLRPDGAPKGALLWGHGGGMVMGDARQESDHLAPIARDLGVLVASVPYRLAPEHPFPAALDDMEAGFRWLSDQPGIEHIAVGGMSAGGGLAASLCQRLRDAGGPQPGFQLLVYPMIDDRSGQGSGPTDAHHRIWDRRSNAFGWSSYLGGNDPSTPHAVPARTEELSGLPPAWIGVGSLDLFHDEDLAYAERLRAAGVEVELDVVDGAYHGFDAVEPKAEVSKAFRRAQLDALRRFLSDASER